MRPIWFEPPKAKGKIAMMKSMTAYAVAEKKDQTLTVTVEIRSYNSRTLDIALRMPPGCASLEEKVRNLINSHLERGRVEVRLTYKDESEAAHAFEIDLPKAKAYLDAVARLGQTVNLTSATVSLEYLAALPGLIAPVDMAQGVQERWPLMAECLTEGLLLIERMRSREGEFISRDIVQRLNGIEVQLNGIETAAEGLLVKYREKLQNRIEALIQGVTDIDPLRLAQEAALLAERSDISEEIVRARSHFAQFRSIMVAAEPSGRKLNFLLQEFNREFNTMGSKVGQASVAHTIVDIKTEIEKIREQIQNIE
jgi:uncharacterized protein (TIGR00255 family)